MSQSLTKLGFLPVNRGLFLSTERYYKDNIVQYLGASFIADPVGFNPFDPSTFEVFNTGLAPIDLEGNLNTGWHIFVDNRFSTGQSVTQVGIDDKPEKGSENFVSSDGIYLANENIIKNLSTDNPIGGYRIPSSYFNEDGNIVSFSGISIMKYQVKGGHDYSFDNYLPVGYNIYIIGWFDSSERKIEVQYKGNIDKADSFVGCVIHAPENAEYLYINCVDEYLSNVNLNEIVYIKDDVERHEGEIEDIFKDNYILALIEPEVISGKYIDINGDLQPNLYTTVKRYNISENCNYAVSVIIPTGFSMYVIVWLDSLGNVVKTQYRVSMGSGFELSDKIVRSPENAVTLCINCATEYSESCMAKSVIKDDIEIDGILKNLCVSGVEIPIAEIVTGKYISSSGIEKENQYFSYRRYEVKGNEVYLFSSALVDANIYFVHWYDENDNHIGYSDYKGKRSTVVSLKDTPITSPKNAAYATLNTSNTVSGSYIAFKRVVPGTNIVDIRKDFVDLSELELLIPYAVLENHRLATDSNGNVSVVEFQYMEIHKYHVEGDKSYAFSAHQGSGWRFATLFWLDEDGNFLNFEAIGDTTQSDDTWNDSPVISPVNAVEMWMNVINYETDKFSFSKAGNIIRTREVKDEKDDTNKLMKVVVNNIEGAFESNPFYIRTKYNSQKDIILTHRINSNGLITFSATYIGDKSLSDMELMVSQYQVSVHTDSTAPLYMVDQYWHLFAQHGYPVPYINNTNGLDSNDVGATWEDQLNRQYTIGKVTESRIWLLPVIYKDSHNHDVRDWKSAAYSPAITSLTYVSGGTHTSAISTVAGYGQEQLRPIMEHKGRKFCVDSSEITEVGTYYCNEFSASESQVGYDPATVQNWFGTDGNPVLEGALPMAEFTYSFNYKGAQCCVNTTINILREVECNSYGATQQQFFFDNGSYKAMFMIPKAKAQNGVELDKPFNSPASNSPTYVIYRNTTHLKDVDDPVDRQIGYLHNPNTGDYLVGMASGLSLVSGDTVKEKRIQNCPIGDGNNYHWQLLTFSPANTNKFYVAAINTAPFANNDFYLPDTYFKEINYYVSYFDPAENVGQVYWYKDGSSYVIYAHCQSLHNRLAINVPEFMEGLKLSLVEKTSSAELLTDTIQNGKFFVNYNTADANYIVLKAR